MAERQRPWYVTVTATHVSSAVPLRLHNCCTIVPSSPSFRDVWVTTNESRSPFALSAVIAGPTVRKAAPVANFHRKLDTFDSDEEFASHGSPRRRHDHHPVRSWLSVYFPLRYPMAPCVCSLCE